MIDERKADGTEDEEVTEQRLMVLEEVRDLIRDLSRVTGRPLGHVKGSVNNAEVDLLNDGEYNYSVRLALVQLEQVAAGSAEVQLSTVERIEEFRDNLAAIAVLPPKDQVER